MAEGWIKLYRGMLDSEQMSDDWLCRLFVWCLLRANHSKSIFRGQEILPGQFVTGRINAASELRVSPSKWYRGIERLEEMGCIKTEANSNWTTLTVCNWKTYQNDADSNEQPADSQRTAGDTTSGQPADSQRTQYKNERMKECENEITNTPLPPEGGDGEKNKIRSGRQIPEFMLPQVQEIYRAYPRHVGTDAAYKAIAKSLEFCEYETLLAITKRYSERRRRPGNDPKLTPHPATWFNQGRWKDDPTEWDRLDSDGSKGVPVSSDTFFSGISDFVRAHQESEGLNEI